MATSLVCVEDYEKYAVEHMSKQVREHLQQGANNGQTYRDNANAYRRYKFRPRYMVDVSERSLTTTMLGHKVSFPIGVPPMNMCRLWHPDGEVALARACEAEGLSFSLAMASTAGLEEIGQKAPGSMRWFQTHMTQDRDMVRSMVQRAERAGFSAVIFTVDSAVNGKRYNDLRNDFTLPDHLRLGNLEPEFKRLNYDIGQRKTKEEWGRFADVVLSPSHTWKDLEWIKSITKLPVVTKGILTGHDANLAIKHGADAIWVSNHGGREMDGLPATFDALGEVVDAVAGRVEVYCDGGIRSGLDALKALARGARHVFVGRPALWGLTKDGVQGVRDVLHILKEELSVGMALTGVTDVQKVPKDIVVHESYYARI